MTQSAHCDVVLFEHWPHPSAGDLLKDTPSLNVTSLSFDMPEPDIWAALSRAHVYQVRSTRSELPEPYWVEEKLFAACPNLLAVSTNGSGYDTVNVEACTAAGVVAVNQAGGNKQAVAEHAFGMMLSLSKRIVEADRAMRTSKSLEREAYMGNNVYGKTLGIVGLGHIGSHVAALAKGLLGMRVIAFDPYLDDNEISSRGAQAVSFDALLGESDFISVHCPRNASSEHMFNADAFARMQPHAYFVSTARGGIHDEPALVDALKAGALAGAGLDVWEQEPPSHDHPLLQLDNVMASPHTAGVTHESRAEVVRITIEQINMIAQGKKPPRILNPDVWPRYCERFRATFGHEPS